MNAPALRLLCTPAVFSRLPNCRTIPSSRRRRAEFDNSSQADSTALASVIVVS